MTETTNSRVISDPFECLGKELELEIGTELTGEYTLYLNVYEKEATMTTEIKVGALIVLDVFHNKVVLILTNGCELSGSLHCVFRYTHLKGVVEVRDKTSGALEQGFSRIERFTGTN